MYLHLGQNTVVPFQSILGIFDLDNTTGSQWTRQFLKEAEDAGRVISISEELPKSFVLCMEQGESTIYLSQLSPTTLLKRAESHFSDSNWSDQAREDIHGRAI
ncbi:MAG: DUF370 domain-containing protein [Oscillospiraceae bacterium]|jgi:hypothetical protein|nr:DUF370 domain-containing protein [Oscillospiraceae bacterium]